MTGKDGLVHILSSVPSIKHLQNYTVQIACLA